ncbi:MAG: phage tail protein [Spirosomataceae bacterium]
MADSTPVGYYPPLSFYFKVEFPDISKNTLDSSFQTVSGLSVEFDTETVKEGGENSFEHKLPVRSKNTDLVLKRGLLTDSEVIQWCRDAFENMIFQPTDVLVKLLNEKGEPLRTWNVVHAWPRKWTVSDFSATDNAVVVETLELSYHYFKVI